MSGTTFTFPYRLAPSQRKLKEPEHPILYPLIPVVLSFGGKSYPMEALIDSGADRVLIPRQIANGMNLPRGKETLITGVGKKGIGFETRIGIMIGSLKAHSYDFGAIDAVYPEVESGIPILLGRSPLFDFFEITFKQYLDKPKVVLTLM